MALREPQPCSDECAFLGRSFGPGASLALGMRVLWERIIVWWLGLGPKRSPWVTSPPLGLQWVLWALSPCVRRHLGLLWKSRGSSLEWRTSYHCSANMWAFNMFGRTPDIWTKVFFFPLQLLKRGQRIFLDPCLFIVQRLHSVIDLHIWK